MQQEHAPPADVAGPSTPPRPRSLHKATTQSDAASFASLPARSQQQPRTRWSWHGDPNPAAPARAASSSDGSAHADPSGSPSARESREARRSTSSPSTMQFGGWERDADSANATVVEEATASAGDSQAESARPPRVSHALEPPRRPPTVFTPNRRVRVDLSQQARSPPPAPATAAREEEEEETPAAEDDHSEGEGPQRPQVAPALITRWLAFFGRGSHGTRARRALVGMVATLSLGAVQFVAILTVLAFGAPRESPTNPGLNEWQACSKPLGVWDILWLLRTMLVCALSVWSYKLKTRPARRRSPSETESASSVRRSGVLPPVPRTPRADAATNGTANGSPADPPGPRARRGRHNVQTSPILARLSLMTTLLSLSWFITAHILIFTSLYTCRFSAPYLWWLTFSIICLTYCAIFEVFLLSLLIFIVGPILFVILNILLLCLGRHPLQNPQAIKPTIGKIPKSTVERIPLVLYIPAPPEEQDEIAVPTPVHAYPPGGPRASRPRRRKFRFALLSRRKKPSAGGKGEAGSIADSDAKSGKSVGPETWEENWQPAQLPFVRLAGNRATCAICLMDFEEPPRARGSKLPPSGVPPPPVQGQSGGAAAGGDGEIRVETRVPVEDVDGGGVHLEDAGEGAQPLRLLKCGHAFHKTCLDPWLTDVSGRCPVCQRPIEVEPLPAKLRGGRWWQRRPRGDGGEQPPASNV